MTGNEYNDKANLNHEYMIVYQDMLRYLSSKDISLLVARDIRDDILAMALESQTRGLKVEEAFGDYQKFCDAVCANAVQETRLEKLLRWWRLLSSLLVLWALLDVIGIGIDESEYVKNGMLFVVAPEDISKSHFIVMSLMPNLIFGFVPFLLYLIFPQLGFLGILGATSIPMGIGDYYNIINALTQMPKGARTYLHGFHSYWYLPEEHAEQAE